MRTCNACAKHISVREQIECTKCKANFHYQCVNISSSHFKTNRHELERGWVCPDCLRVTRRPKHDETPIRNRQPAQNETATSNNDQLENSLLGETSNTTGSLSLPKSQLTGDSAEQSSLDSQCLKSTSVSNISLDTLSTLLDTKLDTKLDIKLKISQEALSSEIKSHVTATVDSLKQEFSGTTDFLASQLNDIKGEFVAVREKMKILEKENEFLKSEITALKAGNFISPATDRLRETIEQLQVDLNDREQSSLLNDVEIAGIPESAGESVEHIVSAVATKLGITLEQRDVVSAVRVGARARGAGEREQRARPRAIAVRLACRATRDNVLREARARRGATTADLGLPPHQPAAFYVNERLTKTNRILFAKAREAGKALQWRFVWIKDGRIYARRSDTVGSPTHFIRREDDLKRVFVKDINTGSNV